MTLKQLQELAQEMGRTPGAKYRIGMAVMGYAIVMIDTDGFESVVQSGIRTYERAQKACDSWTKREAKANRKA